VKILRRLPPAWLALGEVEEEKAEEKEEGEGEGEEIVVVPALTVGLLPLVRRQGLRRVELVLQVRREGGRGGRGRQGGRE